MSDENKSEPVAFDASALTDDELNAEYSRVAERGGELSAKDTLDTDETSELTELSSRLDSVTAERDARAAKAAETASAKEKFGSLKPEPVAEVAPEPAAPVAEPVAEVKQSAPEVPSVADLANQAPQAPVKEAPVSEFSIRLTSDGAGVLGKTYGEEATVSEVARAVAKSFQTYGRVGGGSPKRAIAQFTRDRGAEFQVGGRDAASDHAALANVRREKRLEGGSLLKAWEKGVAETGSLTAAAGWCAPSENLYDLCSLWSMDGMLDLPTVTATRGGFNYTSDPSYADLEAATGFDILTEAEVIGAADPKVCTEIPCPEFTEVRLDVAYTCITASFLQAAGYPEVLQTWTEGLLTNHAHKLNGNIISRLVTQAGAAVVVPAQGAAGGAGTTPDSSATASILAAVELAAEDLRYQSRMPFAQTFEVVLPHWALAQIRADLSRRNGYPDNPFAVTNQMITSWFSVRNIRVQFVYDWQDYYSSAATPQVGIGGPTALTALPTSVDFLIYPAGAAVLARQDVVTLSNVYDSTNIAQNLYTQLFAEEGFNVMYPCGPLRLYTSNLCPSGATAAQVYTSCADAAPAV